jgi:hypothetical protein
MDAVMSGGSFYSQNDFTLPFGLGASSTVDKLDVRWPGGAVQQWEGIAANQSVAITEGSEPTFRRLTVTAR